MNCSEQVTHLARRLRQSVQYFTAIATVLNANPTPEELRLVREQAEESAVMCRATLIRCDQERS